MGFMGDRLPVLCNSADRCRGSLFSPHAIFNDGLPRRLFLGKNEVDFRGGRGRQGEDGKVRSKASVV